MPKEDESKRSATARTSASGATGSAGSAEAGHASQSGAATGGATQTDPIELLKADHRKVEGLFGEFEKADDNRKQDIIEETCIELVIHALLEERHFYLACRDAGVDENLLNEAQVEHDGAKVLIADLLRGSRGDPYREAKFKVLAEEIRHHIQEEEKPKSGVMDKAKAAGVATTELAQTLAKTKQNLMARKDELPLPRPVSFQLARQSKEEPMPSQYRERDERGRFTDDDDDRRGSSRGRGSYAERDDGGRFSSGGERRSFRDEDDDRRSYGRGRGQGGWFGDRDGHSEASRRGWEERDGGSSRSRGRDRDDEDDDRRTGRGRGQGGWFGDSEGHSEAARRGWDEREGSSRSGGRYRDDDDDRGRGDYRGRDDESRSASSSRSGGRYRDDDDDDRRTSSRGRGQGGWFGDSDGHAEAARRGWDERDGGSSRARSRSRDDDEDDRRGRSRGGHGGWFGDSEGHSEAARRGWDDRR